MRSIILYPENDRYVLKRIFKILNSKGVKVDATKIDHNWTLNQISALYAVLDSYSHVIIILSSDNFKESWFVGLCGYILGANKGNYFYFTENDNSLEIFFNKFNHGHGYEEFEHYAEYESKRYNKFATKEMARNNLIERGFALSEDAMGESVSSGQLDIVKDYVESGFSASSRNSKGIPMLCCAIRGGYIDIIKYLIDTGADINAISEDRNNTPIMDAASVGNLESIKILAKEGADLEVKSKNGQTALILAVGHGDVEVSNYLLSIGADYEVKDTLGMSAKGYASLFGKSDILKNMP